MDLETFIPTLDPQSHCIFNYIYVVAVHGYPFLSIDRLSWTTSPETQSSVSRSAIEEKM